MRPSRWIWAAPALLALAAGAATADLPDPPMCTFDDRLGRSPRNAEVASPTFQYVFNGILRDGQGRPVPYYPATNVELVIKAPCPNPAILHPDGDSDAAGAVRWSAETLDQGGGACAGPAIVEIRVLPVGLMKLLDRVASPDEDGDGLVDLRDLIIFQQAFASQSNPNQGDLDLDGTIALSDLVFFQVHFTAPRPCGRLRMLQVL